jgi:hypothetical protein
LISEERIYQIWSNWLAAETRAHYFADLATGYARRKQIITGLSFFLSSGAAVTIIGKAPAWVPACLAIATAAMTAYSIATGLDRRTSTMAKLSSTWREIAAAYERLWNHTYDVDAEDQLDQILKLEKAPSELANTEAPYDEKRLDHWQQRVFYLHGLTSQNA